MKKTKKLKSMKIEEILTNKWFIRHHHRICGEVDITLIGGICCVVGKATWSDVINYIELTQKGSRRHRRDWRSCQHNQVVCSAVVCKMESSEVGQKFRKGRFADPRENQFE